MQTLLISFLLNSFNAFCCASEEIAANGLVCGQIAPPGHYMLVLWDKLRAGKDEWHKRHVYGPIDCLRDVFSESEGGNERMFRASALRNDRDWTAHGKYAERCFGQFHSLRTDGEGAFCVERKLLEWRGTRGLWENCLNCLGREPMLHLHLVPLDQHQNPLLCAPNVAVQRECPEGSEALLLSAGQGAAIDFHQGRRGRVVAELLSGWLSSEGDLPTPEQAFFIAAYLRQADAKGREEGLSAEFGEKMGEFVAKRGAQSFVRKANSVGGLPRLIGQSLCGGDAGNGSKWRQSNGWQIVCRMLSFGRTGAYQSPSP